MGKKRSCNLGALEEEFHYLAVGYAIMSKACEDAALDATNFIGRMRYSAKVVAATVRPAPQAFETLVPKDALYGDAQENSDESKPVFAVNSKVYLLPEIWPPLEGVVESFSDEDSEVICQKEIDQETEEAIIESTTAVLSAAEGILEIFPDEPGPDFEIPDGATEIVRTAIDKATPRIYRAIAEDVYLKWWNRYGKVDDDGELCVEVRVLIDVFVLRK